MYGFERGQVLLHQNGWVYWDGKIFNANDKTLEIVEGYKEYDVAQTLEELVNVVRKIRVDTESTVMLGYTAAVVR